MKPIKGYEKFYSADESGFIWSHRQKKPLKIFINNSGYECLVLNSGKNRKKFLVHRLIAQTFIPNPKKLKCVNHKDGNKRNNVLKNLEWVSYSENIQHALKSGRPFGRRKLTEEQVKEIRNIYAEGLTKQIELAKAYSIDQTVISEIVLHKIWKHV